MSCHDQGTANPNNEQDITWPFPDADGSGAATSGYLQIMPEEFTREELRALLSKARAMAQYGVFNDTKRDLLVDLVEILDLLDALAARDEADLAELEETIVDPAYVTVILPPYPRSSNEWPYKSPRGGG